jgi:hypothetical protein
MIAPAMSPEEWTEALSWPHGVKDYIVGPAERVGYGDDSCADMARLIALANAALPDHDPRKITWAMVALLNAMIGRTRDTLRFDGSPDGRLAWVGLLHVVQLADALASYLPPREKTL